MQSSDHLSSQALTDFKEIYSTEFPDDVISEDELHKRGFDLLKLFALLSKPLQNRESEPASIQVTDIEVQVLEYLHLAIYHNKQSPSVRDIAKVAGVKSSRSGMRLLNRLIENGWVYRNEERKLQLVEGLAACKTELVHCHK